MKWIILSASLLFSSSVALADEIKYGAPLASSILPGTLVTGVSVPVANLTAGTFVSGTWVLASPSALGISTTAPNGALAIVSPGAGNSTTDAVTISSASNANTYLAVDAATGHIEVSSNTPVASGCGTAAVTVAGNDTAAKVTVGTGGASACKLTFVKPFKQAPICVTGDETTSLALKSATTTADVTMTGAAQAGDVIDVICIGTR